jgi:hypothetical protein
VTFDQSFNIARFFFHFRFNRIFSFLIRMLSICTNTNVQQVICHMLNFIFQNAILGNNQYFTNEFFLVVTFH